MPPALPPTRPRTSLRRRLARSSAIGLTALTTLAAGALVTGVGSPAGATLAAATTTTTAASSTASTATVPAARRTTPLPPTPGDFQGLGFDQCLTPSQAAMDRWLVSSPFLAVGIYISGDSRACRSQPNLTPTWVRNQISKGWKLLPITLGPQASCQPRFPRYADDFRISPVRGAAGRYPKARAMGRASGTETVADAQALGISPGSTLWYDLEGFDHTNTACRESALAFISAWVTTVKKLGYVTGVYSSASSGIKAMDDVRRTRPGAYVLPQRIWLARWDGVANTSTSYITESGWRPGGRVKQYRGGHDEVWGGVRINIDSNFLDLGRGLYAPPETRCGGVKVDFLQYGTLEPPRAGYTANAERVSALKCLLKEQGRFTGGIDGAYGPGLVEAVRAWKAASGRPVDSRWFRRDWMMLLAAGSQPVLKRGSAGPYGPYVRRVQRAINAGNVGVKVNVDGTFDPLMTDAVARYQRRVGLPATGIVDPATWGRLRSGTR
ncbi:glycoside hydrolase domain-containing protein [Nocardioides litoris]|uniref:glycoside hydrolase domain-containing protein n=1 Tax=Nocardioides litoris TaxID=1926648 RepID=UPI001120C1C9|nr:glycoside hydrolase domain-containing protein [Nocardioides litoris]